ncbi:uncharacterized protein LOC117588978 [Drosophila guanche]|uniref:Attacin C-terminal domain-containing protein n=1 Tax=Drosophila guanche TaxID=7266 RepID=A0A3B0JZ25_DROGU|nr:uncharacterized protein LOC117588978 [Drosophila guanche]SPP87325.1 Hypothetical predicted protein [Drosophila guanche]
MSSNKCTIVFVLACCLLALASAYPQPEPEEYLPLVRHVRSPEGGSVVFEAGKDAQRGREASVQYNHNLYTSRDGRGSVDAQAHASRNFDYNRNDYGGGIQASWKF